MSYIQFQQRCLDCKKTWNAAFGIVGTTFVAQPPDKCPHCQSTKIEKFADGWAEADQNLRLTGSPRIENGIKPPCSPEFRVPIQYQGRYRLVQDDDCHWYLIPANRVQQFNEWVEQTTNGDDTLEDFDDCRLPGDPSLVSFADPREDK